MTQDELIELMNEDDGDNFAEISSGIEALNSGELNENRDALVAADPWPPPATEEHKVVFQLDEVRRDSEQKATEVFDKLDVISSSLLNINNGVEAVNKVLLSNIDLFRKLSDKFPNVGLFGVSLDKNNSAMDELNKIRDDFNSANDSIMDIMDIMQYQDIHRQKIERVINVMRALSNYMNTLLASKIDDTTRVKSALHIHGDNKHPDFLLGNDDIEALIAAFNKES